MKLELFKPKDFPTFYYSIVTQCSACDDANRHINKILKKILKDPTKGASGENAEGYRSCLEDIIRELENYGN